MVDLCVHTTASTKAPRESNDITTTVYPASDDCVSSISRGMYIIVLSEHSYLWNDLNMVALQAFSLKLVKSKSL